MLVMGEIASMQQHIPQRQEQRDPLRFLWVLLIIVASLAANYSYVIPFLASNSGASAALIRMQRLCNWHCRPRTTARVIARLGETWECEKSCYKLQMGP
jgi:hypothetical protein